jgi:hypothetical protein
MALRTSSTGRTNARQKKDDPEQASIIEPTEPPKRKSVRLRPKSLRKNPPQEPIISASSTTDPSPESEPPAVKVEVEPQKEPAKPSGLVALLKQAKSRAEINSEGEPEEELEPTSRRAKKSGKSEAARDEFSTLVFTVLTILVSLSNLPTKVQPNRSELDALAYNIAGLLVRNLGITGKLGPNALDILGIVATIGAYWARVKDDIAALRAEAAEHEHKLPKRSNGNKPAEGEEIGEPIGKVSPGTGAYLDNAHKGGAA